MTASCGPSGPFAMYSSDPAGHRDAWNVIVTVRCPSAARTRTIPTGSRRGARSALHAPPPKCSSAGTPFAARACLSRAASASSRRATVTLPPPSARTDQAARLTLVPAALAVPPGFAVPVVQVRSARHVVRDHQQAGDALP
jgi:hypothetical protein